MAEGSKAKLFRDLFDRAIDLPVPQLAPEEFDRKFGITLTAREISTATMAEIIVRQLVAKAAAGNDKSIQEVMDRLLGKPMQQTETTVKSYSYQDFLIECRDADAAENAPPRRLKRAEPARALPYDPVAELI